jgi:signal peptidase II
MNKAPISYFHNTIRLEYVENTGAAMSLGDDLPKTVSLWVFSIIPLLILSGVFAYAIKRSNQLSIGKMMAIALIFSGGIGNIIDRLLYDRHVADFLNVGINNFRTGIFNFADVCVTAGVIMFAVFHYKERNKQIA